MSSQDLAEMIRFRWMVAGGKDLPFSAGEEVYNAFQRFASGCNKGLRRGSEGITRIRKKQATVNDLERSKQLNLKL